MSVWIVRLETSCAGASVNWLTDCENEKAASTSSILVKYPLQLVVKIFKQPQPTGVNFIGPNDELMCTMWSVMLLGQSFFPCGKAWGCVVLAEIVVPSNYSNNCLCLNDPLLNFKPGCLKTNNLNWLIIFLNSDRLVLKINKLLQPIVFLTGLHFSIRRYLGICHQHQQFAHYSIPIWGQSTRKGTSSIK